MELLSGYGPILEYIDTPSRVNSGGFTLHVNTGPRLALPLLNKDSSELIARRRAVGLLQK